MAVVVLHNYYIKALNKWSFCLITVNTAALVIISFMSYDFVNPNYNHDILTLTDNRLCESRIFTLYLTIYIYIFPHLSSDLDDPVVTVHQSIGEAKEQFYYERTVFLRCVANSNPPVRYSWHRGRDVLSQGSDKGVEIYEPFFTQVRELLWLFEHANKTVLGKSGSS